MLTKSTEMHGKIFQNCLLMSQVCAMLAHSLSQTTSMSLHAPLSECSRFSKTPVLTAHLKSNGKTWSASGWLSQKSQSCLQSAHQAFWSWQTALLRFLIWEAWMSVWYTTKDIQASVVWILQVEWSMNKLSHLLLITVRESIASSFSSVTALAIKTHTDREVC